MRPRFGDARHEWVNLEKNTTFKINTTFDFANWRTSLRREKTHGARRKSEMQTQTLNLLLLEQEADMIVIYQSRMTIHFLGRYPSSWFQPGNGPVQQ